MSSTYSNGTSAYSRAQKRSIAANQPRVNNRLARTGKPADVAPKKLSCRERARLRMESAVTIATVTLSEWMHHLQETAIREFDLSPAEAAALDRETWQIYYDLGCAPIGALIADACRREAS